MTHSGSKAAIETPADTFQAHTGLPVTLPFLSLISSPGTDPPLPRQTCFTKSLRAAYTLLREDGALLAGIMEGIWLELAATGSSTVWGGGGAPGSWGWVPGMRSLPI